MRFSVSQAKLLLCAALFFTVFDNTAFFRHVIAVYPITLKNIPFLLSLATGLMMVFMLLLTLIAWKNATKPALIFLLMLSSVAAYFMNNYNVIIDRNMVRSILQTNIAEASDLFNIELLFYALFLGALPSFLVYRAELAQISWKQLFITKLRDVSLCLLIVLGLILVFSKFYTSFFREHKPLRSYTNPSYYLYSVGKHLKKSLRGTKGAVVPLGQDAHVEHTEGERKLVILVVGEAARADRLSLNGYEKETNPLLQREDIISYTNVHSCDTSTALSVPCMFSVLPRTQFSDRKGAATENLLDVLGHAGIHVLWRDNNSDSKGTALRVPYQDYRSPEINPICDVECRDEGMLVNLQEYIDNARQGNIFIVLHQMGNHGPAYYKRYPPAFGKFTPVCATNQFDECTREAIGNTYDNSLLYTDFFLAQVIKLLKQNDPRFATAMIYMSDHGESLGEFGIYLHGLPYAVAPESQKRIATLFWLSDSLRIDKQLLRKQLSLPFSHDNLFHTILGLMEVETSIYDQRLDMLAAAKD